MHHIGAFAVLTDPKQCFSFRLLFSVQDRLRCKPCFRVLSPESPLCSVYNPVGFIFGINNASFCAVFYSSRRSVEADGGSG